MEIVYQVVSSFVGTFSATEKRMPLLEEAWNFICSDFRYESDGIFVLGVGFFFFRQISTF